MSGGDFDWMHSNPHLSFISSADEFGVRPRFVRKKELQQYTCGICKDILLQPHQTVCGTRVCKSCIDAKFEGKDVIPCPLPHEGLDEEELQEEDCQQGGLRYAEHVMPDPGSHRCLLKEKCFCKNFDFGCREKPVWKRLKDHQAMCQFVPVHCPNPGCPEKYALQNIDDHKSRCGFMMVNCAFCKQPFRHKDMEEHINECDFVASQCTKCSKRFDRRKQLMVHQRIEPACLVSAGKCHYYDYCKFEAATIEQLANHLRTEKDLHLQSATFKSHELEQIAHKTKDLYTTDVESPLEKVTAETAMNVKKLTERMGALESNVKDLVNAMGTAPHSFQQTEQILSRVNEIERHIKNSGLDRVTVIESHTQTIQEDNELLNDMEKRAKNMAPEDHEMMDYDQHSSITSPTDEPTILPRFVQGDELKGIYTCEICKNIPLQPHMTVCGFSVCKSCIDAKFEGKNVIPCPMEHEKLDEEELQNAECQRKGLCYAKHVKPDPFMQEPLLEQQCFCQNTDFGCQEMPTWENLMDHQATCEFVPVPCPNPGCPEKNARQNIDDHKASCGFKMVNCSFCKQLFRRKDMEEHVKKCEVADSQCS